MESSGAAQCGGGLRNAIGRFFNALPGVLVLVLLAAVMLYMAAALFGQ